MRKDPRKRLNNDSRYDNLNYVVDTQTKQRYVRVNSAIEKTYEKRTEEIIKISTMSSEKLDNTWRISTCMVRLREDNKELTYEHKICLKRRKDVGPYGNKGWVYRKKETF